MATFMGLAKAYASTANPLQTIVELVITPFGGNVNKQGIPRSEAASILRTCINQPIKINFDTGRHKDSYPIGTITAAEETEESIIGRGVLWNEEYPEITEYLKKRTAENNPVGTSWEVLHESSYTEDDIEWLTGTYYAANTIVDNPSYPGKTLMKCVAEDLGVESNLMDENVEVHTETPEKGSTAAEAETLDQERSEIVDLQTQLLAIYDQLDVLYFQTFDIEAAEAAKTENVESFTERLASLVTGLQTRANDAGLALAETKTSLETLQSQLDAVQAELNTLKTEKVEAEKEALLTKREAELKETGIVIEGEELEKLLALDDTAFTLFVSGIKQVKSKSTAEVKLKLPEPNGGGSDNEEVVNALKAMSKNRKGSR